jgi:hypothetical protein
MNAEEQRNCGHFLNFFHGTCVLKWLVNSSVVVCVYIILSLVEFPFHQKLWSNIPTGSQLTLFEIVNVLRISSLIHSFCDFLLNEMQYIFNAMVCHWSENRVMHDSSADIQIHFLLFKYDTILQLTSLPIILVRNKLKMSWTIL